MRILQLRDILKIWHKTVLHVAQHVKSVMTITDIFAEFNLHWLASVNFKAQKPYIAFLPK